MIMMIQSKHEFFLQEKNKIYSSTLLNKNEF